MLTLKRVQELRKEVLSSFVSQAACTELANMAAALGRAWLGQHKRGEMALMVRTKQAPPAIVNALCREIGAEIRRRRFVARRRKEIASESLFPEGFA